MQVIIEGIPYVPRPDFEYGDEGISQLLHRYRKACKLSEAETSRLASVAKSTVRHAEQGSSLGLITAIKLADMYGIPLDELAKAARKTMAMRERLDE